MRFGQIDCCQRLYKVAQSPINRPIWSHWRGLKINAQQWLFNYSVWSLFILNFKRGWVQTQCDQIGRFIGLWATFYSVWQQLICPNLPHSLAIFVNVPKSFIFLVKSLLGYFYRHLVIFFSSHWSRDHWILGQTFNTLSLHFWCVFQQRVFFCITLMVQLWHFWRIVCFISKNKIVTVKQTQDALVLDIWIAHNLPSCNHHGYSWPREKQQSHFTYL